jgi:hemerythrin-like domain-containing protein
MRAIAIIHDEHRSLAAVLHGMLYLVRQIRTRHAKPDFAVLGAMIYYIDAFPERFHHPKEDAYLFKLLRARDPNASELLDRLESEHRRGAEMIRTLEQSLARYQQGGDAEFPAFADAATAYAAFHWDHMRAEEDRLMPMATAHLTEDDWNVIDAAFAGHTDPLFGEKATAEYGALFRRIVTLAPEPIGLGPSR